MKNIFSLVALVTFLSAGAQQSATFQVSGNCGMCKTRIEKAAKEAGATDAKWDMEAKQLTVNYSANSSVASIQQKVAAVGHDNAGARATDEVYGKLHGCCKYDRTQGVTTDDKASCTKSTEACKKDDKKSADCDKSKCSTKEKCTKDQSACKDGEKKSCSKDGKCSKTTKDGADCCKKS